MQVPFQPPPEVLELLLSFVPLFECMTSCCLVNKQFRAAALAVTTSINADLKTDLTRDNSFHNWMQACRECQQLAAYTALQQTLRSALRRPAPAGTVSLCWPAWVER
jgi:hypothetical protein